MQNLPIRPTGVRVVVDPPDAPGPDRRKTTDPGVGAAGVRSGRGAEPTRPPTEEIPPAPGMTRAASAMCRSPPRGRRGASEVPSGASPGARRARGRRHRERPGRGAERVHRAAGVAGERQDTGPLESTACGDISPTVGITSTPVIDPATDQVFVVADNLIGWSLEHRLYAFNLSNGSAVSGFPIDVELPGRRAGGPAPARRAGHRQRAGHHRIRGKPDRDAAPIAAGWWRYLRRAARCTRSRSTPAQPRTGAIWAGQLAPQSTQLAMWGSRPATATRLVL